MKNKLEIPPNKEYQWNVSFANPIAHSDINLVVSELLDIQEVRGNVSPEFIVESAKNKTSVLHSYFQWDDTKAAHKWRLRQAVELLGRIQVKVIKNGEPKMIRAFEIKSLSNFIEPKYVLLDTSSVQVKNLIIKSIISDLNKIKSRLISVDGEQATVFIDKAIEELKKEPIQIESSTTIPINETENILADMER